MRNPILLDCDGVLADFQTTVIKQVAPHMLPHIDKFPGWNGWWHMLSPSAKKEVTGWLNGPTAWEECLPMEGAKHGVSIWREMDARIIVVSSPWVSCPTWTHQRRAWLAEHFGLHEFMSCTSITKPCVSGSVLIDDKALVVHEWTKRHKRRGYVALCPWNVQEHNYGLAKFEWSNLELIYRLGRESLNSEVP